MTLAEFITLVILLAPVAGLLGLAHVLLIPPRDEG